jgi:hypothetical protein
MTLMPLISTRNPHDALIAFHGSECVSLIELPGQFLILRIGDYKQRALARTDLFDGRQVFLEQIVVRKYENGRCGR